MHHHARCIITYQSSGVLLMLVLDSPVLWPARPWTGGLYPIDSRCSTYQHHSTALHPGC